MALNTAVKVSVLSTEYVQVKVSTLVEGLPYNVTEGTVEFAFMTEGDPAPGDWTSGEWETAGPDYYGKILVGPEGDVTLGAGPYETWIRVSLTPQTVVEPVGSLLVY